MWLLHKTATAIKKYHKILLMVLCLLRSCAITVKRKCSLSVQWQQLKHWKTWCYLNVFAFVLSVVICKKLYFLFWVAFFSRPPVYLTAISPNLGGWGAGWGRFLGFRGSGVSIWPRTRGVFLPEINGETWYQQVMRNKHSWLMSLKKNHLRDTLSWSGNHAAIWWMLTFE